MVSRLLNLDGDEITGFSLKASLNFLANLLTLSFSDKSNFVVLLDHIKLLLELLLSFLLLRNPGFILLDLVSDLLLLVHAADLQMATFSTGLQMQRNVLEDRSYLLRWLLMTRLEAKLICVGKVVRIKDFVLPTRYRGDS